MEIQVEITEDIISVNFGGETLLFITIKQWEKLKASVDKKLSELKTGVS
jgi:hypothetical protein